MNWRESITKKGWGDGHEKVIWERGKINCYRINKERSERNQKYQDKK